MFYSLLAMWVVALFYVLGDTADTYFCPVLARLSTEMGLRPHLAGITCLADAGVAAGARHARMHAAHPSRHMRPPPAWK